MSARARSLLAGGALAAPLRALAPVGAGAVRGAAAVAGCCCREQSLLVNEIAILALFAVSLDLILGYAGIVSLGHAAFFGFGAYAAALFAKHVMPDPLVGLAVAHRARARCSALLTSVLILRGTDLTRLMVTLGVALDPLRAGQQARRLTGGADGLQGVVMGPLLGRFEFDLDGRVAYAYSLVGAVRRSSWSRGASSHSPFGMSLQAIRDNRLRAAAIGLVGATRLVAVYTIAAAMAGAAGALLAQTTGFASLDVLRLPPHRRRDAGAGDRRHRLSVRRRASARSSSSCCTTCCRPGRRSTGSSGSACSWSCSCWSAASGFVRPWTWFGEGTRDERRAARRASLVKRFGGIAATQRRLAAASSAARATR